MRRLQIEPVLERAVILARRDTRAMAEVRSAGGLAPTDVQGIARSPDGFLWLASGNNLYCFDNIGLEPIPLEGGDSS